MYKFPEKYKMRYLLFICVFFAFTDISLAQSLIPRDSLIDDFNYLTKAIESTHPDPYSYFGGKIQFYKQVQLLKDEIPQNGLSLDDFVHFILKFMSKLHDGHTTINFGSSPDVDSLNLMLPIKLKIAEDGLFVSSAIKKYEDIIGYKILTIENQQIDKIVQKISLIKPSENIFGSYLNLSKILMNKRSVLQLFPSIDNQLTIQFASIGGKLETMQVDYLPEKQIPPNEFKSRSDSFKISPENKLIDSRFIDLSEKIAYFGWYNTLNCREGLENLQKTNPQYFKTSLAKIYSILKKQQPQDENVAIQAIPSLYQVVASLLVEMKKKNSTHLIVDLRYNPGGWTPLVIPVLYMLFGDQYFQFDKYSEYNTLISELYLHKINQTLQQYNENHESNLKLGDYQFSKFFKQDTSISVIERRNQFLHDVLNQGYSTTKYFEDLNGKPIFKPKLIVLTSPTTFSAAFHFTWFLTEIGNAKIVGVPSSQAGNTFMDGTPYELPKTHLKGTISNSQQIFYPNDKEKGMVLNADFPMNWSLYGKYKFDLNAEILYILDLVKRGDL